MLTDITPRVRTWMQLRKAGELCATIGLGPLSGLAADVVILGIQADIVMRMPDPATTTDVLLADVVRRMAGSRFVCPSQVDADVPVVGSATVPFEVQIPPAVCLVGGRITEAAELAWQQACLVLIDIHLWIDDPAGRQAEVRFVSQVLLRDACLPPTVRTSPVLVGSAPGDPGENACRYKQLNQRST